MGKTITILAMLTLIASCTTISYKSADVDFRWRSTKAVEVEKIGDDFRIITDPRGEQEILLRLLEKVPR